MTDSSDIDQEIAELFERLAVLHRRRSEVAKTKPKKLPVSPVNTQPSDEAIDRVRRGLRQKGIVA